MPIDIETVLVTSENKSKAIPIYPVTPEIWAAKNRDHLNFTDGLAKSQKFTGAAGQILVVPSSYGDPNVVYVGVNSLDYMWAFSKAAEALPDGTYRIDQNRSMPMNKNQLHKAAVGWALARYKFKIKKGALKSNPAEGAKLLVPADQFKEITQEIKSTWLVRDLINMPANVLNTAKLANAVLDLASEFNAMSSGIIKGKQLEKEFPLIHAVGRASINEPLLAHFSWAGSGTNIASPTILLVGKGVTFDNGGVQIKPGASMINMKKDMGGAATAMGLASMIMGNDLPIRLNVVIPIADNAISGNAFDPGDIITARDGTEVEIGHTDAEGRLILADALSFGVEEWNPNIIIDYATLTGAQRVADGTEVGGLFSNNKSLGRAMEDIGELWCDDLQLHHLFEKYRPLLKSQNGGDITNRPDSGPGATMAAMFLQHFIRAADPKTKWLHFDINGMNVTNKPGRPKGGEAMGMRASYHLIKNALNL